MSEILGLAVSALAAYAVYTVFVQNSLQPKFFEMQLLAITRTPDDSNLQRVPSGQVASADVAQTYLEELLSNALANEHEINKPKEVDCDGWVQVYPAGDPKRLTSWKRLGEQLRVGARLDGSLCVMVRGECFQGADLQPIGQRLSHLLGCLPQSGVVEDLPQRVAWHDVLDAHTNVSADQLAGSWEYRFRDYVNEESSIMASARGAFTPLAIRGRTRLDIAPVAAGSAMSAGLDCTLCDNFMLFGFVPVKIRWSGQLQRKGTPRIQWDDTEAFVGWPSMGRSFPRPPPAERLRKEPWDVTALHYPLAGRTSDGDDVEQPVVVLARQRVGRLAFQKLRR